jgi:tetratricopeptide (TPR) repeat protein
MPDETPRATGPLRGAAPPPAAQLLRRLQGVRSAAEARQLLPLLPRLGSEYVDEHRVQRALSEIALRAGAFSPALALAERALELRPADLGHRQHLAICLLAAKRNDEAVEQLRHARPLAWESARELSLLAGLLVRAACHEDAAACYERALALEPGNARHHFSLAATYRFLGRLEEAESACDRALEIDPGEYEAYLVRSDLRTQTAERNHVAAMEAVLADLDAPYMGEVMLCPALAKECEDLGEHERSFTYLARGAALRRRHLSYRVEQDLALIDELISRFTPERLSVDHGAGMPSTLPVFVLGLPRTGTTLVERILSSHSQVNSGGELADFPQLVAELAEQAAPGAASDPLAMVRASLEIDAREIGRRYVDAVGQHAGDALRLIDKLPFNYLNVGLIQRALPAATIIHVTRDPMDTCYAIYKTLFQRAYPFSYDLDDLARYFIAYTRLMAHWKAGLPGRICDVRYEDLVDQPERESRRLIEACGLQWEESMSAFHSNPAPSMTASASQVRRPVYRTSVGKWQHYAVQLQPLLERLRGAGIEVSR